MYSQHNGGKQNVERPWLRYKDKLKANFAALQIDNKDFELNAHDRDSWIFVTIESKNFLRSEFKIWKKSGLE